MSGTDVPDRLRNLIVSKDQSATSITKSLSYKILPILEAWDKHSVVSEQNIPLAVSKMRFLDYHVPRHHPVGQSEMKFLLRRQPRAGAATPLSLITHLATTTPVCLLPSLKVFLPTLKNDKFPDEAYKFEKLLTLKLLLKAGSQV